MKKNIIGLIILSFLMVGCTQQITCNKPYILVGTECCLDQNDNSICDSDEAIETIEESVEVKENESEEEIEEEYLKGKTITQLQEVVVNVNVTSEPISQDYDSFSITGSGFIVDEEGYIITNHHIIERFLECDKEERCKLSANMFFYKEYFDLEVVSYSPEWDFAVLKVKKPTRKFKYLDIAKNSGKIGDKITIIGIPLGYDFSVTSGIISQKNRPSLIMEGNSEYKKYLQTDTAIAPGNSGGPMVNEAGEVIGMTSFGYMLLEGLNFGLQSEVIQELYSKTFKDWQKLLEYADQHNSKSYSKEVLINKPSIVRLSTNEEKNETVFYGFTLSISNNKDVDIKLCYNLILAPPGLIEDYNQELEKVSELKSKGSLQEDIPASIQFDSGKQHYYRISIFDCDSKEEYGIMYGAGNFIEDK